MQNYKGRKFIILQNILKAKFVICKDTYFFINSNFKKSSVRSNIYHYFELVMSINSISGYLLVM